MFPSFQVRKYSGSNPIALHLLRASFAAVFESLIQAKAQKCEILSVTPMARASSIDARFRRFQNIFDYEAIGKFYDEEDPSVDEDFRPVESVDESIL